MKKRSRPQWISEDILIAHDEIMDQVDAPQQLLNVNVKKASLQPCGLPSRQNEVEQLGVSNGRERCFGCCYMGEYDAGAAAYEDIMAILNVVRMSIARTDPIHLARHVAKRYKRIQDEVNQHLQPGEEPLPDWSEATILEHLRYHNTDAELQTWMRISELQEMARVASDAAVVYNPDNGQRSLDPQQTKLYLDIIKTLDTYSKGDPSRKVFYSGGNHMDMKAASQGFIATSGKRLIRYLGQKKRRH